jgi:hypothetical protein
MHSFVNKYTGSRQLAHRLKTTLPSSLRQLAEQSDVRFALRIGPNSDILCFRKVSED